MQDLHPPASQPSRENIRASKVNGTEVFNLAGERLGHIHDIVLSRSEGRAVFAVMSFGGFLGIGERYHALPWGSLTYDELLGGYVVPLTREQIEAAPSYDSEEDPDWNDPDLPGRLAGAHPS